MQKLLVSSRLFPMAIGFEFYVWMPAKRFRPVALN